MKKLLAVLTFLIGSLAWAQNNNPTAPTAPTSTVSTTNPDTTGYTTKTVCASGCDYTTIAAALTAQAGACGSTGILLRLKKGETYTYSANYNFPANNCDSTHWIVIESDDMTGIVTTAGQRIAAVGGGDNSANMPVIECDISGSSCWTFGDNVNAYWLRGFEIRVKNTRGSNNTISLVRFGTASAADPTKPPSRLIMRHMYVHGWDSPWADVGAGVEMNCDNCAVLDSSIERIHFTQQTTEAKAIWTGLGNGPMLVDNNRLEGSTMNWYIGGISLPAGWSGVVPSDITVTRNYMFKPYTWNPYHVSYGGTTPHAKNIFETKYGNRILVEGNVLEDCYPNNQVCAAFNVKTANTATSSWVTTNDIIIRYNKIIHTDGGLLQWTTSPNPNQNGGMSRVAFHNNLGIDIGACTYAHANNGNYLGVGGGSADGTTIPAAKDISFRYNTLIPQTTACTGTQVLYFDSNINTAASLPTLGLRHEYNNNIFGLMGGTVKQGCKYDGLGAVAWDCFDYPRAANDGEELWKKNLVWGASSCASVRDASDSRPYALNIVPSGCFTSTDIANVQFVNVGTGDYNLQASSPGNNASTDGTDVGALDGSGTFEDKTCGAISGNWSCVSGSPAPTVTSSTPASGSYLGGTSITNLAGTGFQAGATVTYGGNSCTSVVVVSATQITCTTPAHAAGQVNIVVTNSDLQSGTCTNCYEFTGSGAPTVSSVSPNNGTAFGGTTITVTGTNFASGIVVSLSGVNCALSLFVNSTTATCITPLKDAPATVNVTVTNPDTQTATLTNGFTFTKPVVGRP